MATYATLTIPADDIIGADFDKSRANATIEFGGEDGPIEAINVDGTTVRLGNRREYPDATGVITFPNLVTTTSASNPAVFYYRVRITYTPKGVRHVPQPWVSGWFPLTASANLAAIPEAWDNITLPVLWRSEFRDEMEALRDQQESLAGIDDTDSAVKYAMEFGAQTPTYLNTAVSSRTSQMFAPDSIAGDGSNVSAAIQALIDAQAAAGGGRVVLARGKTYGIDAPLRLKSRVILDLNGSTLRAISATMKAGIVVTQGVDTANSSGGDATTTVADAAIENGTLDNQGTSAEGSGKTYAMVYVQRASRITVRNCRLVNVGTRQGIRFDKLTDSCVARDNHVNLPLDEPYLTLTNAQGITCASVTVDAYAGGNTDAQTFTEPTDLSRRHTVTGNTIIGGTHGVVLAAAQQCVVANNVIQDTSHRGVIMSPIASRNTVTGNAIRDFGSAAILMAYGSYRNTVSGNTCTTTKSVGECDGIRTSYGAVDNLIQGNTIYGVTNRGLHAFTGAVRNSFIGNKVTACGIGIKLWSLDTDSGYFQPTGSAHMEHIQVVGNTFYSCGTGISIVQGTTTVAASTSGIPILLRRCAIQDNYIGTCTTGITWAEDTPGNMTLVSILGNAFENNTTPLTATRGTFPIGALHGNSGIFVAQKTWAPGAIAAGTSATTTVTVTGCRGGDQASASFSTALAAGLVLTAAVTANDTVTVTIFNSTAGSVTPASSTLRAHAWKL